MINVKPETHTVKTADNCRIQADVYLHSEAAVPGPAIVFIHGGALIMGSRKYIHPAQADLYLKAGYTVISIDYRLAPETKLPGIIEDLEDAFTWVNQKGPELFGIDARRVAAVGHSAGGYLALMAGCRVKPRPMAIVSFYGYGDTIGDWYSKPDPFYRTKPLVTKEESGRGVSGPACTEPYEGRGKDEFYLYCRQNGLWPEEVSGHDPVADPSFFPQYCPLQNVSADFPPTLLLHGNCDTDVPYEQSVLMAEAFVKSNVEHELVTMDGMGHGFDKDMEDKRVKKVFDRVLAFLEVHVGI